MTATVWGIAAYEGPDGELVSWTVGEEEIGRDMGAAAKQLAALGIGAGDLVLWCSQLREAAHVWPFVVGTMLAGARLSCADATDAEAARLAMFTRQLRYRAVMGITSALLDGLDELERPYDEVFREVPVVGARPGAFERLVDAGLDPHRFVLCGPAVAVGTEPGGPATADADEWELDDDAGRVVVTSRRPRATTFDRAPTAIHVRDLGAC